MTTIKKIGIAGEGKMGTNLFYYLLNDSFTLRWKCSSAADIEKIKTTFLKRINRSRDAGIYSTITFEKLKTETTISSENEILADCDLIIEALPEEIGLKRKFFKTIDAVIDEGCIIATNSSSINPTRLIPSPHRSSFFLGLHFFYPVSLKNIVEIIVPISFFNPALTAVTNFLDTVNRNYIILDEGNSFILNRIFLDFQNESFLMVHNGYISIEQLDALVRKYFFPMGVFELFDSVGIDTMLTSIKNYIENYPHKDYYSPLVNHLETMVQKGILGQKSYHGFYQYPKREIGYKKIDFDPNSDPEGKLADILIHIFVDRQEIYQSIKTFNTGDE